MKKILHDKQSSDFQTWKLLDDHQKKIAATSIKGHFRNETNRLEYTWLEWDNFIVDISKNRIDREGFDLLLELAKEAGLKDAIEAQFTGAKINYTEKRAVLHTALRSPDNSPILVDGSNIVPELRATQEKMYAFCDKVISGDWKGYTGKSITPVSYTHLRAHET